MNIVDLIKKKVDLKSIGDGKYRGYCPFHDDTGTPNFTVYENTNSYYCFACGATGNIETWIRKMENDIDINDISYKDYQNWKDINGELALDISEILYNMRDNMNNKKWLRVVGIIFKKLRGELDENQREKLFRSVKNR